MKTRGRPSWFKCDLALAPLIKNADCEGVGEAFKAAFDTFETGALCADFINPTAEPIYIMLNAEIKETFKTYAASVANGKRGGRPPSDNHET